MRKRRSFNDINVVPYIDVSLVLLLVFMITAPLIEQGVDVSLPKADARQISAVEQEPVVISVNYEGEMFVNIADVPSKAVSVNEVIALVQAVRRISPDLPILVRGDRLTVYENIVRVMSLLQNAGVEQVGLMTESPS